MKKALILATTAAMLALPATALGKTIRQEGFVDGDKAASVKLRVDVNAGGPQKVGGFKAKNVSARCDDGKTVRITLTALTPVEVERDGGFKVRLPDGEGGVLRIAGEVADDGRSTKGTVKTNEFETGSLTCKVGKQQFKTSAI